MITKPFEQVLDFINIPCYYADWFHGDAFGLTVENARQLIGFRCHACRGSIAPICPHVKNNTPSPTDPML